MRFYFVLAVAVSLLTNWVQALAAGSANPPVIVKYVENNDADLSVATTRSAVVEIDTQPLDTDEVESVDVHSGRVVEIAVQAFEDAKFICVLEHASRPREGTLVLTGHVKDNLESSVTLGIADDTMIANIRTGKGLIQIRPNVVGKRRHLSTQIDESRLPECAVAAKHSVTFPEEAMEPEELRGDKPQPQSKVHSEAVLADDGSRVDVLACYTATASAGAGGDRAIRLLIDVAIQETNDAYQASRIPTRLRLVRAMQVNYDERSDFDAMLDDLTGTLDGKMDDVHFVRDQVHADLVSLIVNDDTSCGIGWRMATRTIAFEKRAFTVVARDCATGYFSFGHELGHNHGCCHDRDNFDGSPILPYAYGHRFNGSSGTQYRTIMAYDPGQRIQRFSNPAVQFEGTPTGIASGSAGEADNASVHRYTARVVSQFRPEVQHAYFFRGNAYKRFNFVTDQVDKTGVIGETGWAGLWSSDLDSAVMHPNGKAYFFRGGRYQRFDFTTDIVDRTGTIGRTGWEGLWDTGIDASLLAPNGYAYFFKGMEYQKFDFKRDEVIRTRRINVDGWKGVWTDGIDAAVMHPKNGKAYFFKGNQYKRFDFETDEVDKTGTIGVHGWIGLWNSGIEAAIWSPRR